MTAASQQRRQRAPLAPLAPDAFLTWAWRSTPRHLRGPSPLALDDVWFALGSPELTLEELRRSYVRIAARVRRNQRLGLDPWLNAA